MTILALAYAAFYIWGLWKLSEKLNVLLKEAFPTWVRIIAIIFLWLLGIHISSQYVVPALGHFGVDPSPEREDMVFERPW